MTEVYKCIEWLASFIEIFVLFNVFNRLFKEQRKCNNKMIDICLAVIGTVITQMCNNVAIFSYFTMVMWVVYMCISNCYIYKVSIVIIFSVVSFYALLVSYFDFAVLTFVSNFSGGYETFMQMITSIGSMRMGIIIGIKILWILLYLLLRRFFDKFSLKKNYEYTILIISCIGFVGFVFLVNQTLKAFQRSLSGVWFLLLCFAALCLFTGYFIMESREKKMKLQFSEMRNALLEEKYESISEIYANNAKLYHDLNNHLNVLYQLIEQGNHDEAKVYINKISKPVMKLTKTIWTGVDVVDVIINSKLEEMKEKGIAADIQVEFPKNTNIMSQDICTILANLLDNAIEATECMDNPEPIELVIRKINYFLLIKVTNSCHDTMNKFEQYPETTKENKLLHGWGLPSVKDTVSKYNGTLKCEKENGRFVVSAILFFDSVYQ